MIETYLTSKQVADVLGITDKTARLVIQSYIPYLRVGRGRSQYRVARSDLDDYIRSQTVDPRVAAGGRH